MRRHIASLRVVIIWLLVIVACNIPQTLFQPTLATNSPQPSNTPTVEPTRKPTATPWPSQTPVPSDLVWFAPNFGSRDYRSLFTAPEQWSTARSRIDVFKFYTQSLLNDPCAICGQNTLGTFVNVGAFKKLAHWGIAIGVEVGAVKEWGCTGSEEFRVAKEVIRNIQTNGGTVDFLDLDEPYIGGELVTNGKTCGFTMEQSADATSQFIHKVNVAYPNILVGDTEPYPYFSIQELEQWILALQDRGVALAHFHLDVDMVRARQHRQDVTADLRTLDQFLMDQHIPFGVILTSNTNWTPRSDLAFFDATMTWIRMVDAAIGKPEHVVFQSWLGPAPNGVHEVPINLPEANHPTYSFTRLVVEGLDAFGQQ